MVDNVIKIRGARVHNLKNVDLDIPKNKLVVITGLSGSGKSSLAFDTLYAEGQRRYIESLSAYARQFLGVMQKPDVDTIEGISPAISIDQRKSSQNPRSTVGTITEIYDYLRLLFARVGIPYCPNCGNKVSRQTIDQIARQVLDLQKRTASPVGLRPREIAILGPVVSGKKGEHQGILEEIQRAGFAKVRVDGIIYRIEEALDKPLDKQKKHNIEVVIDRLILPARNASRSDAGGEKGLDRSRLVDSLETGLKLGKGIVIVANGKAQMANSGENHKPLAKGDLLFSEYFACEDCARLPDGQGISLPELEPRLFSFNAPYGACPVCHGLGERLEVDPELVIPNPNLSIAEGAIFPWAHASHKIGRQGFFWWKLEELAEKNNFSLNTPIKNLSTKIMDMVLRGEPTGNWEGIIPWLERRYLETESPYAREEIKKYMIEKECERCQGKRLKPEVLAIKVAGESIYGIATMSIVNAIDFFQKISGVKNKDKNNSKTQLNSTELKIVQPIAKEIINRLQFLVDVGLGYLTVDRKVSTLSGGEEQRIRLATQIGSKLTGVLYILDEPSIGLHPRDQGRLIGTLQALRDIGNTVLVVEHDTQTIKAADWVVDVGPGAGKHGGQIIFNGAPKKLLKSKTLTGQYLSGRLEVGGEGKKKSAAKEKYPNKPQSKSLVIKGASENNLKNIDISIPLGNFVCVTGVSGSGKSSLINDILARALMKKFYNAKEGPGQHKEILGTEFINKAVVVDQSPIGRTPRSNPVTYTGCFSYIRDIFTKTKEAKIRGFLPGRFSFNVKGGRCESCEGQGEIKVEMYFLPDIYQECQECKGKRFNQETLSIEYKGKNIADILEMTIEDALKFFKDIPAINQKLKTLNDVGLGYVQLGQPAPYLSGGEAQRIKLATELSKRDTGRTLYILDEPTTGLHPADINRLLYVLKELVRKGNTVLCIEHNMDVVKNSDWIIDLGPEGGEQGGLVVAEGTPAEVVRNKKSYTGQYLKG